MFWLRKIKVMAEHKLNTGRIKRGGKYRFKLMVDSSPLLNLPIQFSYHQIEDKQLLADGFVLLAKPLSGTHLISTQHPE